MNVFIFYMYIRFFSYRNKRLLDLKRRRDGAYRIPFAK